MKEFIIFIKKIWENKKTRSLSILIIYLIFFIFVFSFISSNKQKNTIEDEFYYLNNIEIISYNVYDTFDNEVIDFNKELINQNLIYKLVKNSTLESTNYIENSNTYCISIESYENIVNNNIVFNDEVIRIIISDNNIILDFTNYYGYKINIEMRK
jgi:hypothetical protein